MRASLAETVVKPDCAAVTRPLLSTNATLTSPVNQMTGPGLAICLAFGAHGPVVS